MKGGIIRCTQTEEACPGTRDFRILCGKQGAFETVEKEIEPVGFCSCGASRERRRHFVRRRWRRAERIPSLLPPALTKG
jgi:predicted metal-binding protein